MGVIRSNKKSLQESKRQSSIITREKTSVLKRIPKSKVVLKSSKSAAKKNLKSKEVKKQLRKRRNSTPNNDADKSESETPERTKTDKNKKKMSKNIKSAQKGDENDIKTRSSKLRSVAKRKMSKNESKEQSGEDGIKDPKQVSVAKKRKLLKEKRWSAVETEQEAEVSYEMDLSKDHVLQCINAIFHLTQKKLENKENVKQLFFGDSQPIFMQVTCVRIPKVPRRHWRMVLPHSIITPDDDIALFVCDLQRGRRRDYEPTKQHYEDLIRAQGLTHPITIIPMNQLKTEYDQFELKRKLAGSYDHFFVDGRISGHITHILGSHFYKTRKVPTSVRMDSKDLKHEIEWAMKKTAMRLHSYGDTHIVQVANTSMKKQDILENILAACENIAKNYPGGWANVRCIRIKTPCGLGIPIFITLKNKNSVPVPVIEPKRPKAFRTVEGELSTSVKETTVTVTPDGTVTLIRKPRDLTKRRKSRFTGKHAEESKS